MLDLERAKELCEKATPGPWLSARFDSPLVGKGSALIGPARSDIDHAVAYKREDADLIAFARTFIPAAIERIERLEKALEFYARLTNWCCVGPQWDSDMSPAEKDKGTIAEKALRDAEEE